MSLKRSRRDLRENKDDRKVNMVVGYRELAHPFTKRVYPLLVHVAVSVGGVTVCVCYKGVCEISCMLYNGT